MAFEESFGGQADPGRPYFYKHDARRGVDVSLIIVPVELEDRDAMNRTHGVRKRNKITREMDWTIPREKQDAANKFLAARIWKDTINGWTLLSTESAAELYSKELESEFKKGEEVLMDGRWTQALKEDLLNLKMANWIVVQGTDAQADSDLGETAEKEKNSQTGSTSVSESIPPLRKVSAGDAS